MDTYVNLVFIPAITAFILAWITTPLVIKLAPKLGIVDDPKKHPHPKVIHTYPVPRGGGIPIFVGILTSVFFLPLDKHLIGILLGAAVLVILGILDDRYDLHPYKRLLIQFIVAAIPITAGIGIAFITNPFNGILDLSYPRITFDLLNDTKNIWILSDLFALFWLVTLMNFVNMGASGLDGQLSGTTAIAACIITFLSLRFNADIAQWPVTILAAVTMGSYLGFLPWHAYPQKIMPGFGGSTMAGFMLGVLSILSTTKVGTLTLVLAVPLIDTGFTILRRVFSGKMPFWGDRGHLHHKLLDAGWSKRKVAAFYWGVTACLGILALYLNASLKLYTMVGVTVILGGLLLWLTYRPKQ
jgi:UDP-GlcNAc:undecaprenyl-phosphate GlcNAc-1-phosphate transferase